MKTRKRKTEWWWWQSTVNLSLFSNSLFSPSLQGIWRFPPLISDRAAIFLCKNNLLLENSLPL